MKTLAIVVAYNPDDAFIDRLKAISKQVDDVIVYDNSESSVFIDRVKEVVSLTRASYIGFGVNHGISEALNYGANFAIENNYTYYITFDQDTEINEGFVFDLRCILKKDNGIGAVGPTYIDVNDNRYARFPIIHNKIIKRVTLTPKDKTTDVLCIITSGTMYNVEVFKKVGFFESKYFIDYVDNEYCLRVIDKGFRVVVNPKVVIEHALGERKKVLLFSPTNHSPIRKYYATRNRSDVWKRYIFKFPGYVIYDLSAFFLDLLRVVICEKNKKEKLFLIAKGFYDCILGRFGRI